MYGPRSPVSLTAWRWISTLYILAQHFLYAVVLTYWECLILKHSATEAPTEIVSLQTRKKSGSKTLRKREKNEATSSKLDGKGTAQQTWTCDAEMKHLLALQGENILQWTRSTEQHTAAEIWNHLPLVLGPTQHSLCSPKTNKDNQNRTWKEKFDFP